MKILLTNDDGYGEPGLEALVLAVAGLGDVIVAAPHDQHSFAGHQVTMRSPLRMDQKGQGRYAVHGTPADCVRLALKTFAADCDWVISGINPGANLGSDIYQSGTVAAAREAAILGVNSLAVSHYVGRGEHIDWPLAIDVTAKLLARLVIMDLGPGQYVNVNLPSPLKPGMNGEWRECPVDVLPHRYEFIEKDGVFHYKGVIHDRPRLPGSDVEVCFSGSISMSLLQL